uniref:DNA-directed DNA polymerase n=1 Tax=Rhizophagus irregularis (strain DAOM 181602 / DAOM 197198 / MUCL 43194) TaxID=747089 RepID=U9UR54_RHIID
MLKKKNWKSERIVKIDAFTQQKLCTEIHIAKNVMRAPANEYIGLLPIKLQGRLICPGGTFSGLFFSEELKFALENGYQLLEMKLAYSFKRGANTFLRK